MQLMYFCNKDFFFVMKQSYVSRTKVSIRKMYKSYFYGKLNNYLLIQKDPHLFFDCVKTFAKYYNILITEFNGKKYLNIDKGSEIFNDDLAVFSSEGNLVTVFSFPASLRFLYMQYELGDFQNSPFIIFDKYSFSKENDADEIYKGLKKDSKLTEIIYKGYYFEDDDEEFDNDDDDEEFDCYDDADERFDRYDTEVEGEPYSEEINSIREKFSSQEEYEEFLLEEDRAFDAYNDDYYFDKLHGNGFDESEYIDKDLDLGHLDDDDYY